MLHPSPSPPPSYPRRSAEEEAAITEHHREEWRSGLDSMDSEVPSSWGDPAARV